MTPTLTSARYINSARAWHWITPTEQIPRFWKHWPEQATWIDDL